MPQRQPDPAVWFSILRAARECRDRELETMARRELETLGFRVTIRREASRVGAGSHEQ